jgi:hypothetical protein
MEAYLGTNRLSLDPNRATVRAVSSYSSTRGKALYFIRTEINFTTGAFGILIRSN